MEKEKKKKALMQKNELMLSLKEPVEVLAKSSSSISIKRGTKGNIDVEVKVYNENPKLAVAQAKKIFDDLIKIYPVEP
jgi:hypothetical protein